MKTENLSTLKIHKLSQEQYDRELAAGNIDETALYLTPDEPVDMSQYATQEGLDTHIDDKNNPHGVTAAQVGAPTVAEMNDAIAAIPTPDVSGQINTHNTDASAHADIRNSAVPTTRKINGKDLSSDITLSPADVLAAPYSHSQPASTITEGTFSGCVIAKGTEQNPGSYRLRNSILGTTSESESSHVPYDGAIFWAYE